ncbi:uncharacterized protein HMPREF1541_07383 [Cyphellophora europaea CBS 101466]|uniref:Uncharacterized protein n=1 Tax=Cyphellophora europaea (strain CBS 101466) TaxID=1220924 RepID=W2RN44_CYPE1|nr:uncharacterized protein HMPREF1541_07383 [Cyphellophora europaea CBS 101466]ETN37760.1 hypothetical protein HMPREF1541_07383 [Cyphellophora europaea CBS 101466]
MPKVTRSVLIKPVQRTSLRPTRNLSNGDPDTTAPGPDPLLEQSPSSELARMDTTVSISSSVQPVRTQCPKSRSSIARPGKLMQTKPLPALPTGQVLKRQLPPPPPPECCTSIPRIDTQNHYLNCDQQIMPTSSINSRSCLPRLRDSTYPVPLKHSPLIAGAFDVHQWAPLNSSSGSARSSLQRLSSKVLRKVTHGKPQAEITVSRPLSTAQAELHGSVPLPYEALPQAKDPPVLVPTAFTPKILLRGTTPAEALHRVGNTVRISHSGHRDKPNNDIRIWPLFYSRSKSKKADPQSGNLQRNTIKGSLPGRSRSYSSESKVLKAYRPNIPPGRSYSQRRKGGLWPPTAPTRPPRPEQPLFSTIEEQHRRNVDVLALRPPPRPPTSLRQPEGDISPSRSCSSSPVSRLTPLEDGVRVKLHRHRALLALGGRSCPPVSPTITEKRSQQSIPLPHSSFASGGPANCGTDDAIGAVPPHRETSFRPASRDSIRAECIGNPDPKSHPRGLPGPDLCYPASDQSKRPTFLDQHILSGPGPELAWWELQAAHSRTPQPSKQSISRPLVRDVATSASSGGESKGESKGKAPLRESDVALKQQAKEQMASTPPFREQYKNEQRNFQRGRQLARNAFQKHREGGKWNFSEYEQGVDNANTYSNKNGNASKGFNFRIIPTGMSSDNVTNNGAGTASEVNSTGAVHGRGGGSSSSSLTGLKATVLCNGKPAPSLNAYEAAHAVKSSPSARSYRRVGSSSSSGAVILKEQKELTKPESLRVRSQAGAAGPSKPTTQSGPNVPLERKGDEGEKSAARPRVALSATPRRRPPPPPPRIPPTIPATSTSAASTHGGQETQRRRPADPPPPPPAQRALPTPPPPVPPRSERRPRLGDDWNGSAIQDPKQGMLSGHSKKKSLSTVAENAREILVPATPRNLERPSGAGQLRAARHEVSKDLSRSSVYSDGGQACESASESESEHFWSEDDGCAGGADGEGSSKRTTPEKAGAWEDPGGWEGETTKDGGGEVAEETHLVEYYLEEQRKEVEEKKREDEERRLRVANLMARLKDGNMF